MEKLNERSEARVSFQAPVSLRMPESGGAQSGELRNLSRRGMFVRVADPPHIGAELWCEVAGQPPVRGRVAWVLRNTDTTKDAGVGIELANEVHPSLLEALVGLTFDELEPLELRFADMPSPVRATGRVSDTGIELTTPLAFLRTDAEVKIARGPGPERALRARIAAVRISTQDGVPQLSISLSTMSSENVVYADEEIDIDDSRWFPEISIEESPVALSAESAVEAALIEPEPTMRTPHALWEEPSAHPHAEDTAYIAPKIKAPRTGRWFVGAMLVFMGAGVVWLMTGPTPTVAPAPTPTPTEEAKVELTTVPTTPAATVPAPTPVIAAPAEAPLAPIAMTPSPAPVVAAPEHTDAAFATPGVWHPNIVMNGGQASITIPLTGAAKPLATFTMSDPPGLAIDLPKGKTTVALRSYLLHEGGFRSIWVRTRPTGPGLQIRLHYAKGMHVSAETVDGGVRFRSH
jgi:Tfp pilus assembly protein PilZ